MFARRFTRATFALAAALSMAGCVQTQATMLGGAQPVAAVTPTQVQVFMSEADVKRPFDKIAVINAQGEASMTSEAQMIRAAQKKAAKIGADAIIMGKVSEPSAAVKMAGAFLGTGANRRGEIIAIRFKSQR